MNLDNLKNQLTILGEETVQEVVNILRASDKYATGNLVNSVSYEVLNVAEGLLMNILAADYFKYVDEGRRPGAKRPPTSIIKRWVEAKGIKFIDRRGVVMKAEQTAFIISKSIGEKGIVPLNIKQKVVSNILNKRQELVSKGLSIDIQKYINEEIFKLNN